jgi:hypothetical protein
MARIVAYKRKTAIIFADLTVTAISVAAWAYFTLRFHWAIAIAMAIGSILLANYLFFTYRLFRYFLSVAFSLMYGLLASVIVISIDRTSPYIIIGVVATVISLWLHKGHYDFLSGSKVVEYDKY